LAGSHDGTNDLDFNLVSYNELGTKLWDKNWGGDKVDELFGIAKTNDNQIAVMGYTNSFSGKSEIYLAKRNATNGDTMWQKHFIEVASHLGGDIASCPDGGFILCASQNGPNTDIVIVKTDSDGNYK